MNLISFDPLRTLGLPDIKILNPKDYLRHLKLLADADWILFPPYDLVNILYYAVNPRIFPSVAAYHLGHDKVEMTRAFQIVCPDHIPETFIQPNTWSNCDHLWDRMVPPFVAKDPIGARGKGVHLIESRQDWLAYCSRTPILYVQEYLPIDRDMRLVVIGERVVSGYWRHLGIDGFHTNVGCGGTIHHSEIPGSAIELVEKVAIRLSIDHGGFDVAERDGGLVLFEFNRLFGNAGLAANEEGVLQQIVAYLKQRLDTEAPTQRPPIRRRPQPALRAA
jgi:ribosomal protein S6--L-glutamate ligase